MNLEFLAGVFVGALSWWATEKMFPYTLRVWHDDFGWHWQLDRK